MREPIVTNRYNDIQVSCSNLAVKQEQSKKLAEEVEAFLQASEHHRIVHLKANEFVPRPAHRGNGRKKEADKQKEHSAVTLAQKLHQEAMMSGEILYHSIPCRRCGNTLRWAEVCSRCAYCYPKYKNNVYVQRQIKEMGYYKEVLR